MENNELEKEILKLKQENAKLSKHIDKLISEKDYCAFSLCIDARKKLLA